MSIRRGKSRHSKANPRQSSSKRSIRSSRFNLDRFINYNKKQIDEMRKNLFNRGIRWNKSTPNIQRVNPDATVTSLPDNKNPLRDKNGKLHPAIIGSLVIGAVGVSALIIKFLVPEIKLSQLQSGDNSTNMSGSDIRALLESAGVQVSDTLDNSQLQNVFSNDSLSDQAKLDFASKQDGQTIIDEYTDFRIENNLFGE